MHKPEYGDIYRHFKGKFYETYGVATDCTNGSSGDKYVVYKRTDDPKRFFIRKFSEFTSKVDADKYPEHQHLDRFTFIGNITVFLEEKVKEKQRIWNENVYGNEM